MRFRFAFLVALVPLLAACNSEPAETDPTATEGASIADSLAYDPNASTDSARMGKAGGVAVGGVALTADKTLAQNVEATPAFSRLAQAAKQTDLADRLAGEGPYTIFAPDNAAFNKLPYGAMAGLLKPESKDKLQGLVGYHIILSRLLAVDLRDGQELTTLNGQKIKIGVNGSKLTVNGANVTTPDVVSSNGIIHVIDKVLLPPAE
ncbi:fasciclin domain-containing protein [Hymenobacter busanensis]|uniref:Fasciclin domain-containing protein n=1 Tax=Hymenobacter busanensis TaxID=2607656 RepID=A0A7L4ZUF0_9BACT|nr:fasciclin domain-containing protein [Hymenobacter busanensis]KAA9339627.1 fasciclin domain-containing protein [Hymenobacter busanensis]QHJ06617.1 fasciclin domain-containing protein [Hymenobacter busanensis]